jgi:hypothetical protein
MKFGAVEQRADLGSNVDTIHQPHYLVNVTGLDIHTRTRTPLGEQVSVEARLHMVCIHFVSVGQTEILWTPLV